MIIRNCITCGKEFRTYKCYLKRGNKAVSYCSKSCAYPLRLCEVEGCTNKHRSLGFCSIHYTRMRNHGTLEITCVGQSRPGKHNGMYGSKRVGELNPCWRGGVTPENRRLRNTVKYKNWRKAVFERDNYTCQFCRVRGGNLQADHIKPFWFYKNSRYDIANGRTLCVSCHRGTPTFGRRVATN